MKRYRNLDYETSDRMKIIPESPDFSTLHLQCDSSTNGDIEFDWSLIEEICEASGIDIGEFSDSDENRVAMLVYQWYEEHRARGGAPDPVMEDIIIEAKLEESFGRMGREPDKA